MTVLKSLWQRWGRWVQVAGTLLLFGYLLRSAPFGEALHYLSQARLPYVLLSLLLFWSGFFLYACVWYLALWGLRVSVSFGDVLALFFQGLFINNFASFLGGDLVRGYKLGQATRRGFEAGLSVLLSRLAMLYTLILCAGAANWLWATRAGWEGKAQWAGGVCFASGLLFLALYRRPLRWAIAKLTVKASGRVMAALRRIAEGFLLSPRIILAICAGSLAAQLVSLWAIWWMSVALGLPVKAWQVLLAFAVLRIILILPISFNGLGLREVGLVGLLGSMGVDSAHALALGLMTSALTVASSTLGAIFLLRDSLHQAGKSEGKASSP